MPDFRANRQRETESTNSSQKAATIVTQSRAENGIHPTESNVIAAVLGPDDAQDFAAFGQSWDKDQEDIRKHFQQSQANNIPDYHPQVPRHQQQVSERPVKLHGTLPIQTNPKGEDIPFS